jgi:hypothetical protein
MHAYILSLKKTLHETDFSMICACNKGLELWQIFCNGGVPFECMGFPHAVFCAVLAEDAIPSPLLSKAACRAESFFYGLKQAATHVIRDFAIDGPSST